MISGSSRRKTRGGIVKSTLGDLRQTFHLNTYTYTHIDVYIYIYMFIYICTCIDTQPWKKWLSNRPYFFDSGQNKEFNQPTSLWLIQGNHKWTGRATLKLSPVHGQLHAALMCADTYQSISIHHIIPVHNIDRSFKHIYIYVNYKRHFFFFHEQWSPRLRSTWNT